MILRSEAQALSRVAGYTLFPDRLIHDYAVASRVDRRGPSESRLVQTVIEVGHQLHEAAREHNGHICINRVVEAIAGIGRDHLSTLETDYGPLVIDHVANLWFVRDDPQLHVTSATLWHEFANRQLPTLVRDDVSAWSEHEVEHVRTGATTLSVFGSKQGPSIDTKRKRPFDDVCRLASAYSWWRVTGTPGARQHKRFVLFAKKTLKNRGMAHCVDVAESVVGEAGENFFRGYGSKALSPNDYPKVFFTIVRNSCIKLQRHEVRQPQLSSLELDPATPKDQTGLGTALSQLRRVANSADQLERFKHMLQEDVRLTPRQLDVWLLSNYGDRQSGPLNNVEIGSRLGIVPGRVWHILRNAGQKVQERSSQVLVWLETESLQGNS